jgi:HEAT repeats
VWRVPRRRRMTPVINHRSSCKNVSWYGTHPRYSKRQVKSLLPPAACKQCVYWFRTVIGSHPDSWYQEFPVCPRCGIQQWACLESLNHQLLGISTPYQPTPRAPLSGRPITGGVQHQEANQLTKWIGLYRSENRQVRARAASALVERSDTPLAVLLDILDTLSHEGRGASVEKVLLERSDSELVDAMIARLDSSDAFVREVACRCLGGSGNRSATPHLVRMIDDPHMMVRRAAGFALAELKDPSSIPELLRQFAAHRDDDSNVILALQCALQVLDVSPKCVE